MNIIQYISVRLTILSLVLLAAVFILLPHTAKAATYTVTTTDDAGAGSLRQAITDANGNPGADTIAFNIAGAGVHTIAPLTNLPSVTDQVTVDGSTQPGASCDPRTLLIEIDGENLAANTAGHGIHLSDGSSGSTVKGLVINRFTATGEGEGDFTSNLLIYGNTSEDTIVCNHIGANAAGDTALNDNSGIAAISAGVTNITIGGSTVADRNLVSGNFIGIGVIDATNVNIMGNYIGTDISGNSSLANVYGVYAVSLESTDLNLNIGGTELGVQNTISGNGYNMLIGAPDVTIEGNLIGTNSSGTDRIITHNSFENEIGIVIYVGTHVNIGGTVQGTRNIISGNGYGISTAGNDPVSNLTVKGNYIGLNAAGTACIGQGFAGVLLDNTTGFVIGGNTSADRNVISCQNEDGAGYGIAFAANSTSQGNTIQGNYIGTNTNGQIQEGFGNVGDGIVLAASVNNLIGGTGTGEGNVIAGNGGAGVRVDGNVVDPDNPDLGQSLNNSILGNSIFGNGGLGVDLMINNTPGVTPNDVGDPDYGPNHLMNFPVIQSVTSTNGTATITYDLDINDAEPGATGYRVEFFANDSADASGYGEGQTYLGSDTVAGDVTGQQVTITLPNGVDGSKYITATTTMTTGVSVQSNDVQVQDTPSGFGHTSEFAADVQATLIPPTPTPGPTPTPAPSGSSSSLANTGQAQHKSNTLLIASLLIVTGVVGLGTVGGQRIYSKRKS